MTDDTLSALADKIAEGAFTGWTQDMTREAIESALSQQAERHREEIASLRAELGQALEMSEWRRFELVKLVDEAEARAEQAERALEQARSLEKAARFVFDRFSRDEEQGYRSRDRQFVIEILGAVLRRLRENGSPHA